MKNQTPSIQVSSNFLTDEQLIAICQAADLISCECPAYLVQLLKEVKKFRRYTSECINQFPEDETNHRWLSSQAAKVELLLSQIIYEFLKRESLIDEHNRVCLNQLSERSRKMAINQIKRESEVHLHQSPVEV